MLFCIICLGVRYFSEYNRNNKKEEEDIERIPRLKRSQIAHERITRTRPRNVLDYYTILHAAS